MPCLDPINSNIICPGLDCGRQFKNFAGLSAHQRACRPKLTAAAEFGLGVLSEKAQADLQQSSVIATPSEAPDQVLNEPLELDSDNLDHAESQVRVTVASYEIHS